MLVLSYSHEEVTATTEDSSSYLSALIVIVALVVVMALLLSASLALNRYLPQPAGADLPGQVRSRAWGAECCLRIGQR